MSNETETGNVQVDETVEGQISNPTPGAPKGHIQDATPADDLSGENPGKSDEDQDASRHPDDDDSSRGHDDPDSNQGQDDPGSDEQDTFDRSYVEKLRKENAKYRDRAKHADDLAHRLHTALVAADGRLADPADLPFDEANLDDPEALTAAVTALVKTKPGLRAQQIRGDVGAGDRGTPKKAPVDLIGIMRGM